MVLSAGEDKVCYERLPKHIDQVMNRLMYFIDYNLLVGVAFQVFI